MHDFRGMFALQFDNGNTIDVYLQEAVWDYDGTQPIVLIAKDGTRYNWMKIIAYKAHEGAN